MTPKARANNNKISRGEEEAEKKEGRERKKKRLVYIKIKTKTKTTFCFKDIKKVKRQIRMKENICKLHTVKRSEYINNSYKSIINRKNML